MITATFLNLIYYILYGITSPIRLLPDVSLPAGFTSAMTTASSYYSSLNAILPLDTILILLGIYIAIEVAYLTYKLIMWLIKRFPTQS
jgi:hypothetical protein